MENPFEIVFLRFDLPEHTNKRMDLDYESQQQQQEIGTRDLGVRKCMTSFLCSKRFLRTVPTPLKTVHEGP